MEVLDGSPVSEDAVRYGVWRQSVYSWRDKYKSVVGGIYLADGRECKMPGIDDHWSSSSARPSRPAVSSGRAVADAFTAAMRAYGGPR